MTLVRSTTAAALVLASSAALAQGAVTLYGGVRSGGDFTDQNANDASVNLKSGAAAAFSYDWVLDDGRQAQVFYSFQRSALPGSVANQPGITHFAPSLDGLSSEVRPSMNVGLGHQWLLARQLALRTELRGYLTLVNSSGGFFCSGGCVVKIRGDTLLQVEGLLGLSYAF
jgi:hypothetical protein